MLTTPAAFTRFEWINVDTRTGEYGGGGDGNAAARYQHRNAASRSYLPSKPDKSEVVDVVKPLETLFEQVEANCGAGSAKVE